VYETAWISSPYINHFLQPDTITPGGPQGLNRYSYVGNNPVNFNDPTGHRACGDGEAIDCDGKKNDFGIAGGPPPPIEDPEVVVEEKEEELTYTSDYIGGATPADVFHWQDFSSNSPSEASDPLIESAADLLNIWAMYSPNGAATLQAFITYATSENGDVVEIEIMIVNEGESSATLRRIDTSETALPNMSSCAITTNCRFIPNSPVYIDSGDIDTINICQNCLQNGSTIYSHPFNSNKNNYIEVFMVLSMPVNTGTNGVELEPLPFIYTIPPR
jgi:hypothetical protein